MNWLYRNVNRRQQDSTSWLARDTMDTSDEMDIHTPRDRMDVQPRYQFTGIRTFPAAVDMPQSAFNLDSRTSTAAVATTTPTPEHSGNSAETDAMVANMVDAMTGATTTSASTPPDVTAIAAEPPPRRGPGRPRKAVDTNAANVDSLTDMLANAFSLEPVQVERDNSGDEVPAEKLTQYMIKAQLVANKLSNRPPTRPPMPRRPTYGSLPGINDIKGDAQISSDLATLEAYYEHAGAVANYIPPSTRFEMRANNTQQARDLRSYQMMSAGAPAPVIDDWTKLHGRSEFEADRKSDPFDAPPRDFSTTTSAEHYLLPESECVDTLIGKDDPTAHLEYTGEPARLPEKHTLIPKCDVWRTVKIESSLLIDKPTPEVQPGEEVTILSKKTRERMDARKKRIEARDRDKAIRQPVDPKTVPRGAEKADKQYIEAVEQQPQSVPGDYADEPGSEENYNLVDIKLRKFDFAIARPDFVIVNYGKRRTGKTNLVKNFMQQFRVQYPEVYVFTETMVDREYTAHVPASYIFDGLNLEVLEGILQRQEDRVESMRRRGVNDENINVLIILDDCITEKALRDSKTLRRMFYNGRHLYIGVIINSQDTKGLTPSLRANTDLACIYRVRSERDKTAIRTNYLDFCKDDEDIEKLMSAIHNYKYNCMFVDLSRPHMDPSDTIYAGIPADSSEFDPFFMGTRAFWARDTRQLIQMGGEKWLDKVDWGIVNTTYAFKFTGKAAKKQQKKRGGSGKATQKP